MILNICLGFMVCAMSTFAYSNNDQLLVEPEVNEIMRDWQEYMTLDGVKIEYKLTLCGDGQTVREQNVVLFRFTNLTGDAKTLNWRTKIFRDGECLNCHRIERDEYAHEISLEANQVLEADCSSIDDQSMYIFDNFVKHVPGMPTTRLTDFELFELTVR